MSFAGFVGGTLFRLSYSAFNGKPARLNILIYHRVLNEPDPLRPYEPEVAQFRAEMELLAAGCNVLPLGEAVDRLEKGTLPPRAACVTFDDGYRDNFEVAAPELESLGLPATVFVATGYLDGGIMFNDAVIEGVRRISAKQLDLTEFGLESYAVGDDSEKLAAIDRILPKVKYLSQVERDRITDHIRDCADSPLPTDLMMDREQVRRLADHGIVVGAHTVTHPILMRVTPEQALSEMRDSKAWLEDLLERPVELFAYPNGKFGKDYALDHAVLAQKAGFKAAVATDWGVSGRDTNRFQLPRFSPWDRNMVKFAIRLAGNAKNIHISH